MNYDCFLDLQLDLEFHFTICLVNNFVKWSCFIKIKIQIWLRNNTIRIDSIICKFLSANYICYRYTLAFCYSTIISHRFFFSLWSKSNLLTFRVLTSFSVNSRLQDYGLIFCSFRDTSSVIITSLKWFLKAPFEILQSFCRGEEQGPTLNIFFPFIICEDIQ